MSDVIAPPFSARSKVHEYGGGQFAASGGSVIFVNEEDQDLYLAQSAAPVRITNVPDTRFADMAFDPARPRLYAVTERHRPSSQPQNTIAAVALEGEAKGRINQLLVGRDFYASPRPSPDAKLIAWLAWDLPAMPWEAAELWVGRIADNGGIVDAEHIAGGPEGGAFQPEWGKDGALYFVATNGDWGNLHVWRDGRVRLVAGLEAEFARPLWSLGMTSFAVLEPGRLLATCWRDGRAELGIATETDGSWTPLSSSFTRIDDLAASGELIAFNGGDDDAPGRVHLIARDADAFEPGRHDDALMLKPGDISHARILAFSTGKAEARALYYPPASSRFAAPDACLPPLIVSAHGGPTGMARRGFALDRQYWTTRGFAFLDVDYRGSSGYGREFQRALDGLWGEADSQDAIAAVEFAIAEGLCDAARIVIRGSSAGGLTVLNALIGSERFAAGASYYGVTDLTRLAADTHKFESGYLDSLIGGMPGDIPEVYAARSPVNHADRITAPVIFFQGLDDRVVPPEQSRAMVASLNARGIPVASYEFAGEGHGFRKSDTVIAALEAELAFYARILGLQPGEELAEVEIANFGD
ncbi:MAG: S9 family peptidase [Rhizobiales bacterium]|nr:S9 family peptidase [Hyphomicrobiales bacterium]